MPPDFQTPVESFPIVPAKARTLVFIAFVLAFCLVPIFVTAPLLPRAPALAFVWVMTLGTGAVVGYVARSSRRVRFELSPAGLRVRHSMFGRAIPAADLLPAAGRILSLDDEPRMRPFVRTWGSGLPGYVEGWFRLRDWERAYAFLTDRTRIVDLPTRRGYRLLLSVQEPERFLETAREMWGPLPSPAAAQAPRAVPLEPR